MSTYNSNFTSHAVSGSQSITQSQSTVSTTYSRGDLQSAFNWLVHQPEHIRKQATDPDRLMTLFYRSSNRVERTERIEADNPVSSQVFASDLRQINEAMRQFETPAPVATPPPFAQPTYSPPAYQPPPQTYAPAPQNYAPAPPPQMSHPSQQLVPSGSIMGGQMVGLNARTMQMIAEAREKLNLSSDAEAVNFLVGVAHKHLRSILT